MKRLITLAALLSALAATSALAADAKATYEKECAKCHGSDGKGDTKMGKKLNVKDYTSAKVQDEMKDDKAFKNIKEGMKEGDKTLMKPFDTLKDEEIKELIAYMRKFKK